MRGSDVIKALKKKFKTSSDLALSKRIGIAHTAVGNWSRRRTVTARQVAGLVSKAVNVGAMSIQQKAIRPIVEFFPIVRHKSRKKWEIFSVETNDEAPHPYLEGLRKELDEHHGVYIFFDSAGKAIYSGKARKLSLWKEMKGAFNRPRGEIQKIRRVKHPVRRQDYRTSDEKARQIVEYVVPLHELARYFSAYHVADGMVNDLEAMLIRSFANDLLNTRMERFGQQRQRRGKAKPKRKFRRRAKRTR